MDISIDAIIKEDISNLLYSLNFIYDINNLDLLKTRYMPNISVQKKPKKRKKYNVKKKTKTFKIPDSNMRCKARCWGGKESVKYNPITKKWTYGTLCKKHRIKNSNYCKTHHKQSLTNYGLTNGDFDSEPPHPHYEKYKHDIIKKFNIQN
tara:strand:- start:184 stop:633 length:450 start_codon:yes stop_codon:yes gene_type:complete